MKAVWGKYARVDLSKKHVEVVAIPESWYEKHLGGRGIGARLLIEAVMDAGNQVPDPLGTGSQLLFGTGPFQGTEVPGSGRHVVMGWSPKTKTICESYAGGYFGSALGKSGFDWIVVEGCANEPCYILVQHSTVKILPAGDLWGLDTGSCNRCLKEKHGERTRVSCIGVAGERVVTFACIINDGNRAAGRPGLGAVMGAKNLKAIAIADGRDKELADWDGFRQLRRSFARMTAANPELLGLGRYGTSGGVLPLDELGILPTRNFRDGSFRNANAISGQRMAETILVDRETCTACPVRCKRVVRTSFDGEEVDARYSGPEYETIGALGSLCLIDDLRAIALANHKCNKYGLDTIDTGVLIAFLMEATEKGVFGNSDELAISWGDAAKMNALVDSVATGVGVGELLAQGIRGVAEEFGGLGYAMQIKGVGLPMHDPRGKKGLAISYATSPRGATHLEAMHDPMLEQDSPTAELGVTSRHDRLTWGKKAGLCKIYEDLYSFVNSSILCGFVSWDQATSKDYYPFPLIREMLQAATGISMGVSEMMAIGERNYAIRKILAAWSGYSRVDDDVPARLKEPLENGSCRGERIDPHDLQSSIDEYYELRGFDEHGPTDEKLESLGCSDLIGLIER